MSNYRLTNEDKEQMKLFDIVEVMTNIKCDRKGCTESDYVDDDPLTAAEEFYFRGWRVVRGKALCPKHAPKDTTPIKKKK